MSSAERLAEFIATSREARKAQASRVSGLITAIANGDLYEFDPTDTGDGTTNMPQEVSNSEGGKLSGPQGKAGIVVGSVGESDDSGPPRRAEGEPAG